MNQVNIIGRLGADVDLRYTTTSQKAVAKMSVAVNDRYGENERVYWFSVICWNGLAETVSAYLHKGSQVAVTGRLTTRSFETSHDEFIQEVPEFCRHVETGPPHKRSLLPGVLKGECRFFRHLLSISGIPDAVSRSLQQIFPDGPSDPGRPVQDGRNEFPPAPLNRERPPRHLG